MQHCRSAYETSITQLDSIRHRESDRLTSIKFTISKCDLERALYKYECQRGKFQDVERQLTETEQDNEALRQKVSDNIHSVNSEKELASLQSKLEKTETKHLQQIEKLQKQISTLQEKLHHQDDSDVLKSLQQHNERLEDKVLRLQQKLQTAIDAAKTLRDTKTTDSKTTSSTHVRRDTEEASDKSDASDYEAGIRPSKKSKSQPAPQPKPKPKPIEVKSANAADVKAKMKAVAKAPLAEVTNERAPISKSVAAPIETTDDSAQPQKKKKRKLGGPGAAKNNFADLFQGWNEDGAKGAGGLNIPTILSPVKRVPVVLGKQEASKGQS